MISAPLHGKSIVIVGGTTGLGLSAASAFVKNGASVIIVGRDAGNAERAVSELGGATKAESVIGDASEPDTARNAIRLALTAFGGFHGLYHVAGGSGRKMGDGPLHELTDEGWDGTLRLNLTSLFFSNRAAVRQFLAQGTGGTVLNMGSVLGHSPSPRYFATHAYAAAKAAIVGLTTASAAHYAPANIRFNVLAPALVETPMARRAAADPDIVAFIKTKQPLDGGRIGQPADLDAAAVYFMSDGSRFTTGQVLHVDGGWTVSEGQVGDHVGMRTPESAHTHAVGIDLGGTQIKGVIVDRHGLVLRRELRSTTDEGDLQRFVKTIRTLADDLGSEWPVGLSAPGLARPDRRAIGWMRGRLRGLENLDWTESLGRSELVPVTNDAHAALLGEAWQGAARGLRDVAMFTLGTGVGGAIIAGGRLLRGHLGRAGHVGHMCVDRYSPLASIADMPGALECHIGNYNVRERTGDRFETTHALIEAYRARDPVAIRLWLESVQALAVTVASLINVVDPEAVIIGGGIAQAGEALFEPLRTALKDYEWRPFGEPVKLLPAALGEWAGAIGAAGEAMNG